MKPPPLPGGIKWKDARQAARRIRREKPFVSSPDELLALAVELIHSAMAMIPSRRLPAGKRRR